MKGRDPDYKTLIIEHTVAISRSAYLINLFPKFLQP